MSQVKVSNYFRKNNMRWVGDIFKKHFYDMSFTVPKKLKLKTKVLEIRMTDRDILDEFKPKESSIGELVYALQNDILSKNGCANIFYIRDGNEVLQAVNAEWYSEFRDWVVNANSVEFQNEHLAGSLVVACDFDIMKKNDSLKIDDIEIKISGKKYKLIEKK